MYVVSFQFKLSHAEIVVVDVEELLIVKFNVAILSHPKELIPVQVYKPEEVYVLPFQS